MRARRPDKTFFIVKKKKKNPRPFKSFRRHRPPLVNNRGPHRPPSNPVARLHFWLVAGESIRSVDDLDQRRTDID